MRNSIPLLLLLALSLGCNTVSQVVQDDDGVGDDDATGSGTETLCGDGLDDDGDGLTDCEDPDCAESSSCSFPECSNPVPAPDCASAVDLGDLAIGDYIDAPLQWLPTDGGKETWYRVGFPDVGRPGGSARVSFLINPGDPFVIDSYTDCSTPECTAIQEWDFMDTDPGCCDGDPLVQQVPWVPEIYVRVYGISSTPNCRQFSLRVSR